MAINGIFGTPPAASPADIVKLWVSRILPINSGGYNYSSDFVTDSVRILHINTGISCVVTREEILDGDATKIVQMARLMKETVAAPPRPSGQNMVVTLTKDEVQLLQAEYGYDLTTPQANMAIAKFFNKKHAAAMLSESSRPQRDPRLELAVAARELANAIRELTKTLATQPADISQLKELIESALKIQGAMIQ